MIEAVVTQVTPTIQVKTEGSATPAPTLVAKGVVVALNDPVVVIPYRGGLLVLCVVPSA